MKALIHGNYQHFMMKIIAKVTHITMEYKQNKLPLTGHYIIIFGII